MGSTKSFSIDGIPEEDWRNLKKAKDVDESIEEFLKKLIAADFREASTDDRGRARLGTERANGVHKVAVIEQLDDPDE